MTELDEEPRESSEDEDEWPIDKAAVNEAGGDLKELQFSDADYENLKILMELESEADG